MNTLEQHRRMYTTDYLDAMRDAWRQVDALRRDDYPLARLVWRARSLYREAWIAEERRHAGG